MINQIPVELIPYVQIMIAFLFGSILGFQREYTGKDAGLRTYILVAVGSTLFTIISKTGFNEFLTSDLSRFDPSRIASNIVVGIGFLGAGVIIFKGRRVRGLTTAAGLWVAAAVGMSVGAGRIGIAAFTTFIVFVIFEVMGKLNTESWIFRMRRGERGRIKDEDKDEFEI
ncbi:MAG: hypothetical protein A3F94_00650 [Candidatus Spechtbacteria bacterium RIFCSPLOWO2_12_FULL_38_22]|uniref:MgtC/SapB/SrpB/YhiD N-terminal domain-containing protein n=1 Tax=Candidatus Spechtbacteria bacterium RIFCSPLOWO2_12_FULL_38_22 TaxID=1802165 RepID=A0A1G2HHH4_9BACT|nr:MAG: hypothetical protein A2728_02855 [Candidatus Spechtbacteria bacterium RIFCSPHIGHO2_01_FULL_38_11]OGZ59635.1 MAG: hypothetical protein A3A00_00340 [Candidatus Spechtbacteria bacterium RIFCSPLOWO2_01_FULL_38_20]OGZ60021.1 MAG: hypothetical protein A3E58_01595 [Candidatus Spechtbacteria bacterium RIFCSPHIGHO2_12_FULL_38_30]OGZ61903.1 MAG: hypothetical protein A3F94_00650 [Candidatus Spechtbacteria bacterium RIFCSPLOWO2_12_FULL_38_22]